MTPSELADAILSGSASIADVGNESDWTEALVELEARCIAKGVAVPDRSADPHDPSPLIAVLTGQSASEEPVSDEQTVRVLRASLNAARSATAETQAALERERAAHASTKAELATLRASVESDGELKAAKAEVVKLQGEIVQLKRDHEERIRSLDFDVDQRAAAKIVAIGIREPKASDHAAYIAKTESVTDACRRAAAAQSKN